MNMEQAVTVVRDVARRMHLAYSTEKTYVYWVQMYGSWLRQVNPSGEPRQKVEAFLTSEARRGVSASTQNQAFNALLFLYRHVLKVELGEVDALRAKRQQHVRHAPSVADVTELLKAVRDEGGYFTRLVAYLLYGCGMRVNEPLALRIKDVDLEQSRLTIRDPKHGHDRVVALPCSLASHMERQLAAAMEVHRHDVADRLPVALPGRLETKYPRAAFDASWAWVFPLRRPCKHPRTGQMVRWHMLDQTIQRAIRAAARRAGLSCIITPHHLRHAYATHAMRSGACVRDIQAVLGHRSLETTMGYVHSEAGRVVSPLEAVLAA